VIDGLEDLDPTGLQDILSETVVAGDPLGEGEEALRTADDPGFVVTFKRRAVFGRSL